MFVLLFTDHKSLLIITERLETIHMTLMETVFMSDSKAIFISNDVCFEFERNQL